MKKLQAIIIMAIVLLMSATSFGAVIVKEMFNTPMTSIGTAVGVNEYTLNTVAPFAVMNKVRVTSKYLAVAPSVKAGTLNTGGCTHNISTIHHSTALWYAWNEAVDNVAIELDYVNKRNLTAYNKARLQVIVGQKADKDNLGSLWVYAMINTSASGHYTITAAQIKAISGGKPVNFVCISEEDQGIEASGSFDNITITGDYKAEPKYLTVVKPGYYTAGITTTTGTSADVYVNNTFIGTFTSGEFGIGILKAGDTIRILSNKSEALAIEPVDYQSWYLDYVDGTEIYVEDPPMPTDATTANTSEDTKVVSIDHQKKNKLDIHMVWEDQAYELLAGKDHTIRVIIERPDGSKYELSGHATPNGYDCNDNNHKENGGGDHYNDGKENGGNGQYNDNNSCKK